VVVGSAVQVEAGVFMFWSGDRTVRRVKVRNRGWHRAFMQLAVIADQASTQY